MDDASTNPIVYNDDSKIKVFRSETPSGTGGSFNKAISHTTGDIIFLLCADDYLTDKNVIQDVVDCFKDKTIGYVTRFYYQFIDGYDYPVRAWRTYDPIEQANNPSGLAFRKEAIKDHGLTNTMFIEVSALVKNVLNSGWSWNILKYDTIAVRIHNSTSRSKAYYLKRWTNSPVEEWVKVGGRAILKDHTSLIQIKNYFTMEAVLKEVWNFIRLRPLNLIMPSFWFFSLIAIFVPRFMLRRLPDIYRKTFGKWTTKTVYRNA